MSNYSKLNEFRFRFENKETGKTSYFDIFCCGDIYKQIDIYKKDLKQLCLVGVSNDTHRIIEVIHLFNNDVIYKGGN